MPLPRPASPRALWSDLRAFAQNRTRHQWIAAFFAILMPIVIIIGFITDARTNIAPGEQLIFVDSWSANRSDAAIKAEQKRAQILKEKAQAERQRQYQEVGRRLGME